MGAGTPFVSTFTIEIIACARAKGTSRTDADRRSQ
jgi:hypothetical protein